MNNKSKYYASLDVMKLIAAFLVVAIHTNPLYELSRLAKTNGGGYNLICNIGNCLMDIAVPLFFLCTGYLLQEKILISKPDEVGGILKTSLIKNIKMYIFWSIIYMPLAIIGYVIACNPLKQSLFDYARNFLFRGEHYNSWPLWYLLAAIYAFLYLIMIKRIFFKNTVGYEVDKRKTFLVYFVFILLAYVVAAAVAFFSDHYEQIGQPAFYLAAGLKGTFGNGRVFSGCYFILIGMLIKVMDNSEGAYGIAFIVMGVVLRILSFVPCAKDFGIICMSIGVFWLCINIRLKQRKIYPAMRNLSKWMYYLHMYVFSVISWAVFKEMRYGVGMFLAVAVVTVAVGILIEIITKGVKNKNGETFQNIR